MGSLKIQPGIDEEAAAEAYAMALEDAKSGVLKLATRNLIKGEAPSGFSKVFMPTAPELAVYCRDLEAYLTMLADRTEELLDLPEASPPPKAMTEDERQERLKQIQTLVMAPFIGAGN